MVPGSTFRYGSHFWRVTLRPRLSRRNPIEAAPTPFPSEETTPPVTKMYFGAERKGLDFLRKESAYSTLWSQCRRVSNHDFNFFRKGNYRWILRWSRKFVSACRTN